MGSQIEGKQVLKKKMKIKSDKKKAILMTLLLVNETPKVNNDRTETGCCPRFNPEPWDEQTFVFENKMFVKAETKSFLHIPLNIGTVFPRVWQKIEQEQANGDMFLVLSHDLSAWKEEHYFAVTKDIAGEEMTRLSGTFLTKVFEGPFQNTKKWVKQAEEYVKSKGKRMKKLYFFYTTCPKCAKHFGKNYVVAFIEI